MSALIVERVARHRDARRAADLRKPADHRAPILKAVGLASLLAVSACAPTVDRVPTPLEQQSEATIPNIPEARFWADDTPDNLENYLEEMWAQRRAAGLDRERIMLALSGGADDGAFGAGLLAAWTDRGDRPEFTTVTGVSTGALSAPFAFLGSDWDDALQEVYGGFEPDQIFSERSLLEILPAASAADSGPLANLIAQYVDDAFLAEIAREHRRGRRLFVQTTNLDAQRAMIWDMGAIAASGAPNAKDVFRSALLASASVPGAFPPVLFEVELDGARYDEMHVDGGVVSQSSVLKDWQVDLGNLERGADADLTLYLVRNGLISPEPQSVDYDLLSIGGRAASTMIKSQGVDDLLTAYDLGQLRDAEVYLTWIGEDFDAEYPGFFDPGFMQALQEYGYDLMASGRAWVTKPPQLMSEAERAVAIRHGR